MIIKESHISVLAIIIIIVSILVLFASCTSPTEQSVNPTQILARLIDIPEVDCPLETTENMANPGFETAVSFINEAYFMIDLYIQSVQMIIDGEVQAVRSGNVINISGILSNGLRRADVMIVEGDTLSFEIVWSDLDLTNSNRMTGWINNSNDAGRVEAESGDHFPWTTVPDMTLMGVSFFFNSYSLSDSLNGGGWLVVDDYDLCSTIFVANWDTLGHGQYWGFIGSGEW